MQQVPLYAFGEFILDVRNARLTRGADVVPLPPKTFDVLVVLVQNAGELIEKDALMREVWPETFVEEANIARHVWMLRKALGDDRYIETAPKRGYRFTPEVRTVSAVEPAAAPRRRPGWRVWAGAAAGMAAVGLAIYAMPRRNPAAIPDAVKWFNLGETARAQGRSREAVPFYRHAIELNPGLGVAHSRLADLYGALREPGPQRTHALRAYELRHRASDRERLFIDASYYAVLGDIPRQADALHLLIQSEPDQPATRLALAGLYRLTGRFEAALEEARAAARLDPRSPQAVAALARALVDLNRFDEARTVVAADPQSPAEPVHALRFELAFNRGDDAAMRSETEWAARTANDASAAQWQAQADDFGGRRARAAEWFTRAQTLLATLGASERVAEIAALDASRDASVGRCAGIDAKVDAALRVRTFNTLTLASLARALCGNGRGAAALAAELAASPQLDWLNRRVSVPIIDAFVQSLQSPSGAIAAVEKAKSIEPYELGQTLWPIYLRGLVHLNAGQGQAAAIAFRRILEQRGPAGLSIRYPLARLQLARALSLEGDRRASREAYETFLAHWETADADLPVLRHARREHAALIDEARRR